MDTLPRTLFHVCKAALTAKLVTLSKVTIVPYGSYALKCIIQPSRDRPQMLTDKGPIQMQSNKFNSDPIFNAAQYIQSKRDNKPADHQIALKESEEITKTNWLEDQSLPKEYSTYCDQFFDILKQSESMSDGQIGSFLAVQHGIKLEKMDKRPFNSASYLGGPELREFQKMEINRMPCMPVIEHL